MRIGQELLTEFKAGKRPKELIAEGKNKTSVYKYWKLYSKYQDLRETLWGIILASA